MENYHVFFCVLQGFQVYLVNAFDFGVLCWVRKAFFLYSCDVQNVYLRDYFFQICVFNY